MAELLNNARLRRELLEGLARRLVRGGLPSEEIRTLLPSLEDCGPEAVVEAVDALVASGIELESLKGAISRLLNLLHRSLSGRSYEYADPFFRFLLAENMAALAALDQARAPLAGLLAATDPELRETQRARLAMALKRLAGLELHYQRKENVLFPYFESRHPRYRCLSLMWSIHDDVRRSLRKLQLILDAEPPELPALKALTGRLFFDIHSLVFREEKILFPVIAPLFSPAELGGLYREARNLGPGFFSEAELASFDTEAAVWTETESAQAEAGGGGTAGRADGSLPQGSPAAPATGIRLGEGSLSPQILDLILKTLPLDITFVDADDRVRYFSAGQERIFPRSAAIIGREVKNCHPASSVDKVMAIVESFRRGERDREAFWIELKGRFIHIEYRALRGAGGEYLGTLEISQDLSEKRALSGEKRLSSF